MKAQRHVELCQIVVCCEILGSVSSDTEMWVVPDMPSSSLLDR
jgi:hypothetical protein